MAGGGRAHFDVQSIKIETVASKENLKNWKEGTVVTATERIAQLYKPFIEAFEKQDPAMAASIYADDAQVLPANSPPVTGKQAIQAFWRVVMRDMGVKRATLKSVAVEEGGELIVDRGDYELFNEADASLETGNYIVVFKGGQLLYDMFHSDKPAA